MRYHSLINLFLIAIFSIYCQQKIDISEFNLTADFNRYFLITKDYNFKLKPDLKKEAEVFFKDTYLVMVSFPSSFTPSSILGNSSKSIGFFQGHSEIPGWALMKVQDSQELDELVKIISPEPLASLEIFDFRLQDQAPRYLPAMFADHVRLPEVSALLEVHPPSQDNLRNYISEISSLPTRYHTTVSGLEAPSTIEALIKKTLGANSDKFSITKISHAKTMPTNQQSLVVSLAGEEDNNTAVVIGAHLDSINNSDINDAPGADDDASGMAVAIETIRIIGEAGLKFQRRIDFHFYASEEVGLLGSHDLAATYAQNGPAVESMVQLDMTAQSEDPSLQNLHLLTNRSSPLLLRSLKNLLNLYLDGGYENLTLKHGSSDHSSWTSFGIPAVLPFEDQTIYPKMHTSADTLDNLNNFDLCAKFVKTMLAYLAHHAGLVSAKQNFADDVKNLATDYTKDLAIAIVPEESLKDDSLVRLAIGTPKETIQVGACLAKSLEGPSCRGALLGFSMGKENGTRKFFVTNKPAEDDNFPLKLVTGDVLQIFGYDARERMIQNRMVVVEKE